VTSESINLSKTETLRNSLTLLHRTANKNLTVSSNQNPGPVTLHRSDSRFRENPRRLLIHNISANMLHPVNLKQRSHLPRVPKQTLLEHRVNLNRLVSHLNILHIFTLPYSKQKTNPHFPRTVKGRHCLYS
jgi:hypothetical protein